MRLQFRYPIRRLAKTPSFTVVVVLTLALGIGATTAIFSVVNAVLIEPLPYPDPDRLVMLWHTADGVGIDQVEQSVGSYTIYRELNETFEEIGIYQTAALTLTAGDTPVRVAASEVTPSLFRVVGVPARLGRWFEEEEGQPDGPRVAIISQNVWASHFGSDPEIIGREIEINRGKWTVVGVMPSSFDIPMDSEIWLPLVVRPEALGRANFSWDAVGRLKAGISLTSAETDLERILPQLPAKYPGELTAKLLEEARLDPYVITLRDEIVGDVEKVLWILFGSVGFVLLIACANVANLFLVRIEGRQREIALRKALGAGQGQLTRHFVGESVILALAGGALGLAGAVSGVEALISLSPFAIPRFHGVDLDATVLIFTLLVSMGVGFLFGTGPAFRYRRLSLANVLNQASRGGSSGRPTNRARNLLIISQLALAVILLVGSGLMARSFWTLRRREPGFLSENVLAFRVFLPGADYKTARQIAAFHRTLLERLESLPGVERAGAITNLPLTDGQGNDGVLFEDFPVQEGSLPEVIRSNWASPGYFEALGIPLIEGRLFEWQDQAGSEVIVNRAFARAYWPQQSALGKRVAEGLPGENKEWATIVGVVGDVHDTSLETPMEKMIYYPMSRLRGDEEDFAIQSFSVALNGNGGADLVSLARKEVRALDPRLPIVNLRLMTEVVSKSMARTTFTMLLLSIAGGVALVLGTVGIYGVIAYVVVQRTREIGVRLALGAGSGRVKRMVLRQSLAVALLGIVAGLAGAAALAGALRLLEGLLVGVDSMDPATYAAVAVGLLMTSGLAAYLPARRAARIPPAIALTSE